MHGAWLNYGRTVRGAQRAVCASSAVSRKVERTSVAKSTRAIRDAQRNALSTKALLATRDRAISRGTPGRNIPIRRAYFDTPCLP